MANRTAGSEPLVERAARDNVWFTLVVPATPGGIAWAADMDSGEDAARQRLEAAVSRYRAAGLPLRDARIGHPDPLAATLDAVHFEPFAEIVVSTPPHHLSAWLRISLPHRVAHATGLPVTYVEAPRSARAARPMPARSRHGLRTISSARGWSPPRPT